MTGQTFDPREQGWPKFSDFPQTEVGWNIYANQWSIRRRRTAGVEQIPMGAIDEYRAAIALGARLGWQECEGVHQGAHMPDDKDDAGGAREGTPWPLFEDFAQSGVGYGKYLAAWIRRRRTVADIDDIAAEPLIDHWLASRKAIEQDWSDIKAMEDYEDDPDDLWAEAEERLYAESECVYSLFWDSGGSGAGAAEERIYRWKDKYFFFSDYWDVPNPFESLDAALDTSGLLNVNIATRWIRCKELGAEELTRRLSVGDDVNGLEINSENWLFDSTSNGWTKEQS